MKKINLFIILILFSIVSYAFVPVVATLLGQNVIRTGITRLIAKRVLPIAANDAVYLTVVNNTRSALNKSVVNLSSRSSLLKTASGLATFAFIAEQFNHRDVIKDISYISDNKSVLSHQLDLVNYRFYVPVGSGGTSPYLFSNDLDSLANDAFLYNIKHGLILNTCNKDNCRFSNLRDLKINKSDSIYNVHARYDYDYKNYAGDWVQAESSYLKVLKDNPVFNGLDSIEKIVDVDNANKKLISSRQITDILNSLMMDASLLPDYKGMPFSTEKPFTESEVKESLKTDSILLPELLKGIEPYREIKNIEELNKELNINNPIAKPDETGNNSDYEGDVKYPDLEMPTAEKILEPYKSFFPELQNFKLTARNVQCPVWNVPFLGKDYKMDSHCPLIEENRGVFESVFALMWAFIALRKLLSA